MKNPGPQGYCHKAIGLVLVNDMLILGSMPRNLTCIDFSFLKLAVSLRDNEPIGQIDMRSYCQPFGR